MNRTLLSMVLVAVYFAAAQGADYFVSPSGLDSNPGTEESPLLNIKTAIEKAAAGTTIYLREGIYKPSVEDIMKVKGESNVYDCVFFLSANGTSQKPITITGYPGETVVIDLSDIKSENRIMGFDLRGDQWHLRKSLNHHHNPFFN